MWINYNKGNFIPNGGTHRHPESLMKAMHPLIEKLGHKPIDSDTSASNNIYLKCPAQSTNEMVHVDDWELAELVKNVFDAALEDIQESYDMGVEKGSNLLLQLQSGAMTMEDFEKVINKSKLEKV